MTRRDETFTVGEHAVLDIELASGSVQLRPSPAGVVSISVDASNADSFDVVQLGDQISIRPRRRRGSARVVADVPTGTDVQLKSASADVSARAALGALRVRSASGDIRADDVVRAEVTVASGDVAVDLVRDGADVRATSGDVVLGSVGGRLSVTLTSGDLRAGTVSGDADVEAASGDVSIGRFDGSAVTVRTMSGDIRLGLPTGIRVEPDLTTLSGKVRLPSPTAAPQPERRRSVRVRLRSVSGDIRIDRAG